MSVQVAEEVLRPYDGVEELTDLLDSSEVWVRGTSQWTTDSQLLLRPEDYEGIQLQVRWTWAPEMTKRIVGVLAKMGLAADDVMLSVVLRCPLTKTVREAIRISGAQLVADSGLVATSIDLSMRPSAVANRRILLETYFAMATEDVNRFPHPNRKAIWLAQKQVELCTLQHDDFDFDWEVLTDEIRRENQLHKESVLFIRTRQSMHEADRFSDCVEVFVDPVHSQAIAQQGASAVGRMLQASLIREVLACAWNYTLQQLSRQGGVADWAEIESTPVLGRFCRSLASKGSWANKKLSPDELYRAACRDSSLMNEYLDDFCGSKKLADALVKDGVE